MDERGEGRAAVAADSSCKAGGGRHLAAKSHRAEREHGQYTTHPIAKLLPKKKHKNKRRRGYAKRCHTCSPGEKKARPAALQDRRLALTFEAPADWRALLQLCILQNLVELGRKGLRRAAPSLGRLRSSGRLAFRPGRSRRRTRAGSRSSPVLSHERAARRATLTIVERVRDEFNVACAIGVEKREGSASSCGGRA